MISKYCALGADGSVGLMLATLHLTAQWEI